MSGTILTINAICMGFIGLFSFVYALTFGLTRHLFEKIKIYYLLILGLIFGAISLLVGVLIKSLVPVREIEYFSLFLPALVYGLTIIFVGFISAIGVAVVETMAILVLPSLMPSLFQGVENNYLLAILVISYLVITMMAIFKKYFQKVNNWWVWSVFSLSVLLSGLLFIFVDNFSVERITRILVLSSWILTGYLCFAIFSVIEAVYRHALKLRNIIAYDQNRYILESGANMAVTEYVTKNRIKYGLFVNYYIANFEKFEKKLNGRVKEYIIQNIAGQAYKSFQEYNQDTIFFKSSYKLFGAFIPLEEIDFPQVQKAYENNNNSVRDKNDILNAIQITLKKIKTKFKIDNYFISVKLLSSVSIYGIHSNDVDQLQAFNRYSETEKVRRKNINEIVMVNPTDFYSQLNQNRKLLALNEIVDLNHIGTRFEPIFSLSKNKIEGFYLNPTVNGLKLNDSIMKKSLSTISESGLESLFRRFASLESLKSAKLFGKQISDKKIFFNYDQWVVSGENFSLNDLFDKLKNLNLVKHNLCFLFDITQDISSIEILKKNISGLKKAGIKIGLTNFGSKDTGYHLIGSYQPDYLFLDEQIINKLGKVKEYNELVFRCQEIAKKIDAKIIFKGVDNFLTFKKLTKYENDLIAGKLIGSSNAPKAQLGEETIFLLNKKD
ncbi:EAL domain-containing protein [Spiroplasma endosymbiont of Panorpa germanica]|uniref:EAL domain-containing protein n=1 Tax=Spiroplasma endosymbiont of Panorpa germanica TaxID=3066314 RepID=UPI0030CE5FA2